MALQIKDETMLRQIDQLSKMRGITKTEVLRTALKNELAKETGKMAVKELLGPLLARVDAMRPAKPMTLEQEKRLSDELWGE